MVDFCSSSKWQKRDIVYVTLNPWLVGAIDSSLWERAHSWPICIHAFCTNFRHDITIIKLHVYQRIWCIGYEDGSSHRVQGFSPYPERPHPVWCIYCRFHRATAEISPNVVRGGFISCCFTWKSRCPFIGLTVVDWWGINQKKILYTKKWWYVELGMNTVLGGVRYLEYSRVTYSYKPKRLFYFHYFMLSFGIFFFYWGGPPAQSEPDK